MSSLKTSPCLIFCFELAMRIKYCNLQCSHTRAYTSLLSKEEEEKGPGFSRSHMRLIAVEFHLFCILLMYFCTLVTPLLVLHVTLSVDLL